MFKKTKVSVLFRENDPEIIFNTLMENIQKTKVKVSINQDFAIFYIQHNFKYIRTEIEKEYGGISELHSEIINTGNMELYNTLMKQQDEIRDNKQYEYEKYELIAYSSGPNWDSYEKFGIKLGFVMPRQDFDRIIKEEATSVELLGLKSNPKKDYIIFSETETDEIDWKTVIDTLLQTGFINVRETEHEYRSDNREIIKIGNELVKISLDSLLSTDDRLLQIMLNEAIRIVKGVVIE